MQTEHIPAQHRPAKSERKPIPVSESDPNFRWTDESVFARFGRHSRVGTCELEGCRIDDPIVYAFPAAHDLKPPLLHWRCFQRAMTQERKFASITQRVHSRSRGKAAGE